MRGCACRGTAGLVHVSCLAEQAKILFAEAEENKLGYEAWNERWARWHTCSLCEQNYHGTVRCALGWACWKTYVSRPETDRAWGSAMTQLGNGLDDANHNEDALFVREAELSMLRRLGAPEDRILIVQTNVAGTYARLGRLEEALQIEWDVYSGNARLYGEEHPSTLIAANNYADSLTSLERFEEAKALLRATIPVARRVLGAGHDHTLRMSWNYARALYRDPAATLADLREAVRTLEETERTARRVFGGAHPTTGVIKGSLHRARAALSTRETPPTSNNA